MQRGSGQAICAECGVQVWPVLLGVWGAVLGSDHEWANELTLSIVKETAST